MFGSAEGEDPILTSRKIIFEYSNICEYNTSTLQSYRQTDGGTDKQTTCRGNTALSIASRGNKTPGFVTSLPRFLVLTNLP